MSSATQKAHLLVEAIKYIKKFENKIVVVKYGGNAMESKELKNAVFEDIAMLSQLGMKIVVVHGGGPSIDEATKKAGLTKKVIHGLRVTDAATLEIVQKVLSDINQDCISHLKMHHAEAVDLTEGALKTEIENPGLGFVGEIKYVNNEKINEALDEGIIPVISSIGRDSTGQLTNINADTVATHIAIALKSEKLTILTNVDALVDANDQRIPHIDAAQAQKYIDDGTISGGMIPKILAGVEAVNGGVNKAHFLNGTIERALLLEIFTDEGIGTEVVKS